MSPKSAEVLLTANFEQNLDEVERFLAAGDAAEAYGKLLDVLSEDVIPVLEQFPSIGRPISGRRTLSAKVRAANEQVIQKASRAFGEAQVREYILPHYLVLYAATIGRVYLLAIRHHRQLSYDLHSLWIES